MSDANENQLLRILASPTADGWLNLGQREALRIGTVEAVTIEAKRHEAFIISLQDRITQLEDLIRDRSAGVLSERAACLAIAESCIDGELYQGARIRDAIRARGGQ